MKIKFLLIGHCSFQLQFWNIKEWQRLFYWVIIKLQKYKQIDLLHISDQASIIKSSKAIVRQVSKEFFKTILQGRKKLFYGGAGGREEAE